MKAIVGGEEHMKMEREDAMKGREGSEKEM